MARKSKSSFTHSVRNTHSLREKLSELKMTDMLEKIKEVMRKVKGPFKSLIKKLKNPLQKNLPTAPRPPLNGKTPSSGADFLNLLSFPIRPENRGHIHYIFKALCFISISYGLGKGAAILTRGIMLPQSKKPSGMVSTVNEFDQLHEIKKLNIFNAKLKTNESDQIGEKKNIDKNILCKKATKKSTKPLKLLSTIVLQREKKSVASIRIRSKIDSVRQGDRLGTFGIVGHIDRLKLIFKNLDTGECEYITSQDQNGKNYNLNIMNKEQGQIALNKKISGIKNDGNNFTISRKLINEKLEDISSILGQAQAIKIENPDGSLSFKIVDIAAGSIFSHLGITDGDKIKQIDGKKISNMNEIMNLFGKIKSLNALKLMVNRNGNDQELNYNFSE